MDYSTSNVLYKFVTAYAVSKAYSQRNMMNSLTLNRIDFKQLIRDAKSIAIISHVRPDGDTLGSGLSLYEVCRQLGKKPTILCESSIPEYLQFMHDVDKYRSETNQKFDVAFALDCADVTRMGCLADVFLDANTSVNIDHHKDNDNFGQLNIVDRYSSSTCQIMCEIYLSNGIPLDKTIATHIYTGLSTDTGNFMHSTVNYSVFGIAAILLGCGVDLGWITTNLYKSNSKKKLKLLGYALSKIEYYCDDKVALLQINESDLQACGVGKSDTENLVSYCSNTKGVVVAALMTQIDSDKYKVSFRSNSDVDVSEIASTFGGGGHKQAAGCLVDGDPKEAHEKVLRIMFSTVDCDYGKYVNK